MTGGVVPWIGSVLTSLSVLFAALTYKKAQGEKASRQASGVHGWIRGALVPVLQGSSKDLEGISMEVTGPTGRNDKFHLVWAYSGEPIAIHVLNSSDHPVYDCRIDIQWVGYFVNKLKNSANPISVGPDGEVGFNLLYADKMRQRILWLQKWMPREGELVELERFFSPDATDPPMSPLPPSKKDRKFNLESDLVFVSQVAHFEKEDEDELLVAIRARVKSISFVDNSGNKWLRHSDGRLKLVGRINETQRRFLRISGLRKG